MPVVAVLLGLGILQVIDVLTVHDEPEDRAAMTEVAASYLDAVRDGDLAAAYPLACGSERTEYPLPRWRPFKPLDIESYRITRTEVTRSSEHGPS